MKKYRVEIEVSDDFEPGYCYECPLNITETYDDDGYIDYYDHCALMCSYESCPLSKQKEK